MSNLVNGTTYIPAYRKPLPWYLIDGVHRQEFLDVAHHCGTRCSEEGDSSLLQVAV